MTHLAELQEFFANAAENAMRMFNESGEVLPMWHAEPEEGAHLLIATPWSNDEEKDIVQRGLRLAFADHKVVRYAFISEVWLATVRTLDEAKNGPRPSVHPDRREALMIQAEDRYGNRISGEFYILRPEHGKPTLSPLHMDDYDVRTGRFMGMLR
jgi:hypothetical protein